MDHPPPLAGLTIAVNKSGGLRIVLEEDLAEHLANLNHPTHPERIFEPEGWKELTAPPSACTCPACGVVFTP